VQAQRKLAQKAQAEEEHLLVDPEDEGIQQMLHSALEPTLLLDAFLAVDSKLEMLQRSGQEVPTACETLWRDINRMIDRLGLNSRSLQSFILGHTTERKEGGRHKQDLENGDDWVLIEAEDLGAVIDKELAQPLEKSRIKDIAGAETAIQSLAKDLAKLRAREEDIRKVIYSHVDPDQVAVAKSLPLSAEQATQQNELRRSYANFTKLLAETEEALTMLKTKLASAGGASGKAPVPTVEAILRTINKMTSMAEKRSGDVDVLENQMRRLRLGSVGPGGGSNGTPGSRSREGSPFVTPQHKRSVLMSPERGMRDSVLASSVASYAGRSTGTPSPRKKPSMYSDEEKRGLRAREAKRKGTLAMLRASLARAGPNVSRLRDDD
jgi:nucleoporin NUP159